MRLYIIETVFGLYGPQRKTITKTRLYNFDPLLNPHFYKIKLGFKRVYIIFLISAQKHILWVLVRAASSSIHNLCFLSRYILSEIFQFLVVNFSVFLNRHVFVMQNITSDMYAECTSAPSEPCFFARMEKKKKKKKKKKRTFCHLRPRRLQSTCTSKQLSADSTFILNAWAQYLKQTRKSNNISSIILIFDSFVETDQKGLGIN